MGSTREQLQTLLLSADDIRSKNPGLDESFVLDYLNQIRNLVTVAVEVDDSVENIRNNQQEITANLAQIARNRGRINDNQKSILRLDQKIDDVQTEIYNYMPFKGYILKIKGTGATSPTIIDSYNVASVIRTGLGVYQVTLNQGTILGASIANNSIPSIELAIAASATSAMYTATANTFVTTTFNLNVFAVTVGATPALALTPYDLQTTDTLSMSGLMNVLTGLPPV